MSSHIQQYDSSFVLVDNSESQSTIEITHRFAKNRALLLLSRGVDHDSFMKRADSLDIYDSISRIETAIPRMAMKSVSRNKQYKNLEAFVEKPLTGNPVLCISSFPTDLRAKQVALYLMNKAIDAQATARLKRIKNKALPLWHRVYGGYTDVLRDGHQKDVEQEHPCLLVISNLDENSTTYKCEKVRDLLDIYSSIPRIVITSPVDPLTFFATKLHIQLSMGLYIGPCAQYKLS
jgi:hypothetical protein